MEKYLWSKWHSSHLLVPVWVCCSRPTTSLLFPAGWWTTLMQLSNTRCWSLLRSISVSTPPFIVCIFNLLSVVSAVFAHHVEPSLLNSVGFFFCVCLSYICLAVYSLFVLLLLLAAAAGKIFLSKKKWLQNICRLFIITNDSRIIFPYWLTELPLWLVLFWNKAVIKMLSNPPPPSQATHYPVVMLNSEQFCNQCCNCRLQRNENTDIQWYRPQYL